MPSFRVMTPTSQHELKVVRVFLLSLTRLICFHWPNQPQMLLIFNHLTHLYNLPTNCKRSSKIVLMRALELLHYA